MSTDLALMSATDLIAGFRDHSISPREATAAALDQISAHNDRFNAYCLIDVDGAMAAAGAPSGCQPRSKIYPSPRGGRPYAGQKSSTLLKPGQMTPPMLRIYGPPALFSLVKPPPLNMAGKALPTVY
jgi:hypothetical protein